LAFCSSDIAKYFSPISECQQIFNTLFRYRTVRQQLSLTSLITDVGLSAHLWLHVIKYRERARNTHLHIVCGILCILTRPREI
jgi:hypothetical protein